MAYLPIQQSTPHLIPISSSLVAGSESGQQLDESESAVEPFSVTVASGILFCQCAGDPRDSEGLSFQSQAEDLPVPVELGMTRTQIMTRMKGAAGRRRRRIR
eukprot:583182-Rhodomonas_salina.1